MEKVKHRSAPAHLLSPPRPPVSTKRARRSKNYVELSRLGEGAFGTVSRYLKQDTNEIVAVKKLKNKRISAKKEISMLEKLRCLDAHECHIVRFYESFRKRGSTYLVFELLDISLYDYMKQRDFHPLPLDDIRCIIGQLAIAFKSLKTLGVFHTDFKPDNVMLVDHRRKPLKVKLIDFGLAITTCEAKQGSRLQPFYWRSPEILLGLQFSEAIDMWSLGCVLAEMLLGYPLFSGQCEYELMRCMVQLLGQPEDHLLEAGLNTKLFFKKSIWRRRWRLMTPKEYSRKGMYCNDTRRYSFISLVQLKEHLAEQNRAEADDIRDCVDLMKALLEINANWRITPDQILAHPFILKATFKRFYCWTRPQPCRMKLETEESSSSRTKTASTIALPAGIVLQPLQTDGAAEQQSNNQQNGPQGDVNKIFPEILDLNNEVLKPLSENGQTPAITEASAAVKGTEVGAATPPAVASGVVSTTCVPLSHPDSSPATDLSPAATTNSHNGLNTEPAHTTSDASKPEKKQQKKKKNRVRRFFSRLMRALGCCCSSKKKV